MSDKIEKTEKPTWWSKAHDLSWDKVKTTITADWHKVAAGAGKLEDDLRERAAKFGHGAQDVYKKFGTWSGDVEAKLKADWDKTQHKADETWEKVRDAVKHSWEKTRSAVSKDAKPSKN